MDVHSNTLQLNTIDNQKHQTKFKLLCETGMYKGFAWGESKDTTFDTVLYTG